MIDLKKNFEEIRRSVSQLSEGEFLVVCNEEGMYISCFYRKKGKLMRYSDCITSKEIVDLCEMYNCREFDGVDMDKLVSIVMTEKEFLNVIKNVIRDFLLKNFACMRHNLVQIVKEANEGKFNFVSFDGDIGVLVCATSTDEDYYWCYVGKDMKVHYTSCVGGFEIVERKDLSTEYSVLQYLVDNDKKSLVGKVMESTDNNVDVIISDISF